MANKKKQKDEVIQVTVYGEKKKLKKSVADRFSIRDGDKIGKAQYLGIKSRKGAIN